MTLTYLKPLKTIYCSYPIRSSFANTFIYPSFHYHNDLTLMIFLSVLISRPLHILFPLFTMLFLQIMTLLHWLLFIQEPAKCFFITLFSICLLTVTPSQSISSMRGMIVPLYYQEDRGTVELTFSIQTVTEEAIPPFFFCKGKKSLCLNM